MRVRPSRLTGTIDGARVLRAAVSGSFVSIVVTGLMLAFATGWVR